MHKISAGLDAKMGMDGVFDGTDTGGKVQLDNKLSKKAKDMKLQFTVKTFGVGPSGDEKAAVSIAALSIEDVIEQYK